MDYDKIWILNPDYILLNDLDRVCLKSKNKVVYGGMTDWKSYIHPWQATILQMFDGRNDTTSIVSSISEYFGIDKDNVEKLLSPYMANDTAIYTEWDSQKIPFPKNLLIDVANIAGNLPSRKPIDMNFDWGKIDLTSDRAHRAPHSMLWMLTNKCATNCAYCYADKNTPYIPLSTNQALSIIDEAYSLGITKIDVIGGEVFLKKDWDLLIGKMIEYGMSPSFISTKVPINDDILSRLLQIGYNNVIQVSLDSINEEILKRVIHSTNGYGQRLKESIVKLDNAGFKIQIDTILTKETATKENLEELAGFLSKIVNFEYWEIRVPDYSLYSPETFQNSKAPRELLEEIEHFVNEDLKKKFDKRLFLSLDSLKEKYRCMSPDTPSFPGGTCGFLDNTLFVLPDGKVSVCELMYWHHHYLLGDLKLQSIEDIWQSDKAKAMRHLKREDFRKESACRNCKSFDGCNKSRRRCVIKVIKAYGKDNWDYPDPRCVYAPKLKNDLEYK